MTKKSFIKSIDVTKISNIVFCTSIDQYIIDINENPLSDYNLYVVKNNFNFIEVFYGKRKLRDTLVVSSLPYGRDYPNSKLYVKLSSDRSYGTLIYKDSRGNLTEYGKGSYVKCVNYDGKVLTMSGLFGDFSTIVISRDGQVSEAVQDILDYAGAVMRLSGNVNTWGSI